MVVVVVEVEAKVSIIDDEINDIDDMNEICSITHCST